MADAPKRIQRKRTKGWRMPEAAIYVGRPTQWGNPFDRTNSGSVHPAVRFACEFAWMLTPDAVARLRGHDLACWCKLCPAHAGGKLIGVHCDACEPCHVDVLLEIANG